MKTVGVLAIQGDFAAHAAALVEAGAQVREVRTAAQLLAVDALVIPGGESTTMLKLIEMEKLTEALARFGASSPVFGTCAGAILMAKGVTNPTQFSFGMMDIDVERNGYGRQLDSRVVELSGDNLKGPLAGETVEAVFIRAPIIRRVGEGGVVLAQYQGDPVLVQQGRHMVATFHPELATVNRIHRMFVERLSD